MKVAVLVSGEPRFSKEFDLFLENLTGYDEIDWYFYLWNNATYSLKNKLMPPSWFGIDNDSAYNKLRANLPADHNIAYLGLADQNLQQFPIVTERLGWGVRQDNVWRMWYSWMQVDSKCPDDYDIVIKARPDLALMQPVNLKELNLKSNELLLPNNYGGVYNNKHICDLMAISSRANIKTYNNIINHVAQYYSEGYSFHPETMLSRHLDANGIVYPKAAFDVQYRYFGKDGDDYNIQYGRWV